MKLLNLSDSQRIGCTVTYNLNKFCVYLSDGCFLTSATDKADLKAQLAANRIAGARFDSAAQRKYLAI